MRGETHRLEFLEQKGIRLSVQIDEKPLAIGIPPAPRRGRKGLRDGVGGPEQVFLLQGELIAQKRAEFGGWTRRRSIRRSGKHARRDCNGEQDGEQDSFRLLAPEME
jgi:hypothetical protein